MVSLFVEAHCELGEGPVWDHVRQCLWWVDITNCTIYRADHLGHHVRTWPVPERVGFVLPHPDGTLWAGLQSGIHRLSLTADGDITLDRLTTLTTQPGHQVRYNDACVDATGTLFATTMDLDVKKPLGQLHCHHSFESPEPRVLLDQFVVGNGPALSPDGTVLYVNETVGHEGRKAGIYTLPMGSDGPTGPETLLIDWSQHEGNPDGVTVDADGNLWVGGYGTRTVFQFSPDGQLLRRIEVPAWNITKPALGPDPRTIFVTSARQGLSEEQLAEFPQTGSVWKITL